MKGLPLVLLFTAMTFVSWGAYGPVLHHGSIAFDHDAMRAFVGVGLAYFMIAVLIPVYVLRKSGETGSWTFSGTVYSLVAGAVGAIGALGIILALGYGGQTVYVMPLVFGFAPVVNTLVTAMLSGTFSSIRPIFIAGIFTAALGAAGVLVFKPPAGPAPVEPPPVETVTEEATSETEGSVEPANESPEGETATPDNAPEPPAGDTPPADNGNDGDAPAPPTTPSTEPLNEQPPAEERPAVNEPAEAQPPEESALEVTAPAEGVSPPTPPQGDGSQANDEALVNEKPAEEKPTAEEPATLVPAEETNPPADASKPAKEERPPSPGNKPENGEATANESTPNESETEEPAPDGEEPPQASEEPASDQDEEPASESSGPYVPGVVGSIILAAICWGSYGPMLHVGQARMKGSRLRPFTCVGIAYFIIAVAAPLALIQARSVDPGAWTMAGMSWSFLAGVAGAIGALGVILAFNAGGKPYYVMPLIFGFAPVINTFISLSEAGTWARVTPMFWVSLGVVILGAVTVLSTAPKPAPKKPATS